MTSKIRHSWLVFACLLFLKSGFSQIDTNFWFAAPEISASVGDNPIFLRFMTYANPANVEVTLPSNSAFTPINLSIPANSIDSINLAPFLSSIESPAADVVSNNGIKISASNPVSAFYELRAGSHKELFTLKGSKALGDNFYTPFQTNWDNGSTTPASFSSIDIVATENNTTVLITPRTAITGHAQNVTFSVVLNEGETYSARDMNTTGASTLAGSIVSSNKPIAVTLFSGALDNGGCLSATGDQITNQSFTGNSYVVHKGTASSDRVYILATENGTNVTVSNTGTTSALINWGETYEVALSDLDNYISTNKPVYVWHVSGYGCNLSAAQVPPLLCAGTYSTAFTRTSADSLGVFLYTRTGFENQFALNGNGALIPAGQFTDVPGTSGEFKMALIYFSLADVPLHSYNEVTNAGDVFGLGVITGNDGNGSGYGYLSEFNSYPFATAGNDTSICANTTINLNGQIGGGDITGLWSTSGFGTFALGTDTLINQYIPSPLDTLISPIDLILTSTGSCLTQRDTITLTVSASPIVNASADQSVCENNAVVQLSGDVQGGATTGVWSTLGSGSFSPNNTTLNAQYVPSATDITAGTVQLVLSSTGAGACLQETDTMQITITSGAIVDAGVDTLYACENNASFGLSGTVSGATSTGKWITSGSGIFTPDNISLNSTYIPSQSDIVSGAIMIYLESTSNGNCVPVLDSIQVIFTTPPTVDAGINQLICANDAAISLNGSISGVTSTGVWSNGNGTFSSSDTDLNATYTPTPSEISAGTLILTLTSTSNGGCLAESDVVQINFIAEPNAIFNFTEECLYTGVTFTDFSQSGFGTLNSWQWDFGDMNSSTDQHASHDYSSSGTYDVQLIVTNDNGCTDTVTNSVQVFEVPTADFTYTSDCPNNQIIIDFTDNSSSGDPINYWFYDFGGQGTSATANPSQIFNADGDYTITHIVGTTNGCYDTTTQVISVPPFPQAGFSYNTNNGLNIGAVFNFVNTSQNASSYSWDFGNNINSTEENPTNTYFSNGTYVVTQYAYGDLGCVDSTSQTIVINTVTNEISTLIPNAISPNDDGKNDIWKLEFIDLLYPQATVDIFNQWGQTIYSSTGYDVPWNGTFNGELVPDGTYFYVINLNDDSVAENIFKGTILVLKSKE